MLEVNEDVKKASEEVKDTDKVSEKKKVIITEDDMMWLGNCSLIGFEQYHR